MKLPRSIKVQRTLRLATENAREYRRKKKQKDEKETKKRKKKQKLTVSSQIHFHLDA